MPSGAAIGMLVPCPPYFRRTTELVRWVWISGAAARPLDSLPGEGRRCRPCPGLRGPQTHAAEGSAG